MRLDEIFDADSASYKWSRISPRVYGFEIEEDRKYTVTFIKLPDVGDYIPSEFDEVDPDKSYEISFFLKSAHGGSEHGIVGTGGKQIKIFGTVIDVIKDFLDRTKPQVLAFSAKEPSRKRLYKRFISQAKRKFPQVKTAVSDVDGYDYYWMVFK